MRVSTGPMASLFVHCVPSFEHTVHVHPSHLRLLMVACGTLLLCVATLLDLSPAFTPATPPGQALAFVLDDVPARSDNSIVGPTSSDCDPDWQIVDSPNAITSHNYLRAVDALSADNVWAVGYYQNGTHNRTLAMHWDGTAWIKTATPNLGSQEGGILLGVAVVSATDAWAVGYYPHYGINMTMTLRWDGNEWSETTSPNVGLSHNYLSSVSAVSSNDVWAVGNYYNGTVNRTLTLHWTGSTWDIVDSPNANSSDNYLSGVTAIASADIWAVGSYQDGSRRKTLTMHWTGSAWTIIVSPNPSSDDNYLRAVTAVSANDVWAVGHYVSLGTGDNRTLTIHWNGSYWLVVIAVNPSAFDNFLYGVTAVSANEIWAVGQYYSGTEYQTLALRWDGSNWNEVTTPDPGAADNGFHAMTTVSSSEVWAVGQQNDSTTFRTLAARWNGSAWNAVASPNAEAAGSVLSDVSALSENDVWAVGSVVTSEVASALTETLTMRWNGSAWAKIPSPNPGTSGSSLVGVKAISPNDVWAVGTSYQPTASQALTMHWDGSAWQHVIILNLPGVRSSLYDVDAVSSDDVWAVGYSTNGGATSSTLTIHWNGSAWAVINSPNPGTIDNALSAVTAISSGDIWAIGRYSGPGQGQTSIMHGNGSTWSVVASPSPGAGNNRLDDVDAVSANDIWAVGSYTNGGGYQTLTLHWNGSLWSVVPSLGSGFVNYLYGVTAVASNDVWAVGYAINTLVMHWDGSAWSVVPSPSLGSANNLYGVTAISANDVWAVGRRQADAYQTLIERYHPCICPGEFTDVLPGSTFYPFVRCMACRGIINGYASGCGTGDPCFRPNNNVTRGQLAKIVANSAGFAEPAGAQQYEDVPPGSTFFDFIWRLSNRGHVSGYACGGPGEPCNPPGNRPYFRPNANATRGQISKIVANSAGFSDPPGSQIFEDVPSSHTFFDFVQRLANRDVTSGYACGGPGEPCNPPGNRPYFRPNYNATRGQTSKIVANTFFPDCSTGASYNK